MRLGYHLRGLRAGIALQVALGGVGAATAAAQGTPRPDPPPPTDRCQGEVHRQFDFWLGRWEVRGADGALLGHNDIQSVANGCGLVERWQGADGGSGVSVNSYDAGRGKWTQRWVGEGTTLWLEGGLEGGRMVLRGIGPRSTPRGAVLDRLSWAPLPDGRVRQLWETSVDGGGTWREIFKGLYTAVRPP